MGRANGSGIPVSVIPPGRATDGRLISPPHPAEVGSEDLGKGPTRPMLSAGNALAPGPQPKPPGDTKPVLEPGPPAEPGGVTRMKLERPLF